MGIVMTIKICQIKGANGAGKTTIVHQLMMLSKEVSQLRTENGVVIATCFDTIKWAAVGPYDLDKKMGGCDRLDGNEQIMQAILTIRQTCPDYWIVFEGMMISTLKTTFYNFLVDLMTKDDVWPLMVILRTDMEHCVQRIQNRGTVTRQNNGVLNVENIRVKCESVIRHAKEYDPSIVRYIDVDNVFCSGMLVKFLDAVGDTKLLDWMFDYRDVEEPDYIHPLNREYQGPAWLAEYSQKDE
jgi:deoxyadenosine/deoxycytidine kinase